MFVGGSGSSDYCITVWCPELYGQLNLNPISWSLIKDEPRLPVIIYQGHPDTRGRRWVLFRIQSRLYNYLMLNKFHYSNKEYSWYFQICICIYIYKKYPASILHCEIYKMLKFEMLTIKHCQPIKIKSN